jgi:hypothetical protein
MPAQRAVRTPRSRAGRIAILDENLKPKRTIELEANSDLDQVALSAGRQVLRVLRDALHIFTFKKFSIFKASF